jgi:NitT/TauT family transport system substrate-binding protein
MSGVLRLNRRVALGLLAGPLLLPIARRPRAQTLDRLSFQTDWRAQAEHGGYYQALAAGLYKAKGLEVDLRPGGPNLNNSQLLMAGRADLIMAGSFGAFAFLQAQAPFFTIAAIFQKDPQALLAHPGSGIDGFDKLKGKTLLISSSGRVAYWPYLRKKFGLSDDQVRPYNFQMAPFLLNPNAVQQGFVTSEAYSIAEALGKPPVVLMLADAGFSSYQTTIATSRKLATEKREVVQRFVDATLEGWSQYLKGGPATEAANALIKQANPEQTDDRLAFAIRTMNERGIVRSGDALTEGIGAMSDARWRGFYDSMTDVEVMPKGMDVRQAYTLEFVNKGIGKG